MGLPRSRTKRPTAPRPQPVPIASQNVLAQVLIFDDAGELLLHIFGVDFDVFLLEEKNFQSLADILVYLEIAAELSNLYFRY